MHLLLIVHSHQPLQHKLTITTPSLHLCLCSNLAVYKAPEMLPGEPESGAKTYKMRRYGGRSSDVYAFATIMWEVLTGRKAWDGLSDSRIAKLKTAGGSLDMSLVKRVPEPIIKVMFMCLESNMTKRPTIGVVREVLD